MQRVRSSWAGRCTSECFRRRWSTRSCTTAAPNSARRRRKRRTRLRPLDPGSRGAIEDRRRPRRRRRTLRPTRIARQSWTVCSTSSTSSTAAAAAVAEAEAEAAAAESTRPARRRTTRAIPPSRHRPRNCRSRWGLTMKVPTATAKPCVWLQNRLYVLVFSLF